MVYGTEVNVRTVDLMFCSLGFTRIINEEYNCIFVKKKSFMLKSFYKYIFVIYASTYVGHLCFDLNLMVTSCSLARAGVHVEN